MDGIYTLTESNPSASYLHVCSVHLVGEINAMWSGAMQHHGQRDGTPRMPLLKKEGFACGKVITDFPFSHHFNRHTDMEQAVALTFASDVGSR